MALQLFQPTKSRQDMAAVLPLEPGLARLSRRMQEQLSAITANLEDVESQVAAFEEQDGLGRASSSRKGLGGDFGGFGSSRRGVSGLGWAAGSSSSPFYGKGGVRPGGSSVQKAAVASDLLYKTVEAQQATAVNLAARIEVLRKQLEELGVVATDPEHQGGRSLERYALLEEQEDDQEYGEGAAGEGGLLETNFFGEATPGGASNLKMSPGPAAGSSWGRGSTPSVSRATLDGSSGWVTPGSKGRGRGSASRSGQAGASPLTPATISSSSTTSSAAWQSLTRSVEKMRSSGGGRVRVTRAKPLPVFPSPIKAQQLLAPDRPASPLQITAAGAWGAQQAVSSKRPAASPAFSFPISPAADSPDGLQKAAGFSTPESAGAAASRGTGGLAPTSLNFGATSPLTPSPSPLGQATTPPAALGGGGGFFMTNTNPLFDSTPGTSAKKAAAPQVPSAVAGPLFGGKAGVGAFTAAAAGADENREASKPQVGVLQSFTLPVCVMCNSVRKAVCLFRWAWSTCLSVQQQQLHQHF